VTEDLEIRVHFVVVDAVASSCFLFPFSPLFCFLFFVREGRRKQEDHTRIHKAECNLERTGKGACSKRKAQKNFSTRRRFRKGCPTIKG